MPSEFADGSDASGGLTTLDDLPGDDTDNSLIDYDILQPPGTTGQIVYNNGGVFAAKALVDGDIPASIARTSQIVGAAGAYGAAWNGDTGIPQKDTIFDYLVLFDSDYDGDLTDESWFPGSGTIEDVAYDYTTWNGDADGASKNVLRDYFVTFDTDGDGDIDTIDAVLWATKQDFSANLQTFAAIAPSANVQSFLGAANYAAMKSLIDLDDLHTLTGISAGTTHLGTFAGSTIADSLSIKDGMQSLETAVENRVSASSGFSNDNRLVRSDGTDRGAQATGITVDDSDNITGVESLSAADIVVSESVRISGIITPTQLSASQNNYTITNFDNITTVRLSSSSDVNITGLTGGVGGRYLILHNIGSYVITLVDESGDSTAANRFATNGNYTIPADGAATVQYDSTGARWRILNQLPATLVVILHL
jgi:hypothetical protein